MGEYNGAMALGDEARRALDDDIAGLTMLRLAIETLHA
jgi:hypothetical protein